ncbi:MAG: ribose-phosphate diphosphokinase [Candidatus Hydrogenedens sp.]|nr:ribose-phosphate diphosphokinase [Candidatus Hydrogenedens sp.]
MKIFSGRASQALTAGICEALEVQPARSSVSTFSDGEINVQIGENVRGRDVFLVNSTSPPVNRNLMEMLIMIDAAKRASAERVTAVIPYYGYARQDRKEKARVPITAKLVANLITAAGADRILAVDLHCGQIQGFFDIPVDHLAAEVVFVKHLEETGMIQDENFLVVSPDMGSVKRAREFADRLGAPMAIVDKRRPKDNVAEVMNIIGDVKGMHCMMLDDMIDTAGTLCKAAEALKSRGALSVRACATHPVFSGKAIENIANSELEEVIVCDSIPLSEAAQSVGKITQLSLASLIAEAIRRVHKDESVSSLFKN